MHHAFSIPRYAEDDYATALNGYLTVLGDKARAQHVPWANPGTDRQFPANSAGNSVSVRVSPGFAAYRSPPPPKRLRNRAQPLRYRFDGPRTSSRLAGAGNPRCGAEIGRAHV